MNDRIKEIQKDVDKMSSALVEPEGLSTDAPNTKAPGTEAPSTDAPSTDAPSTDAPSTDAPSTDAPSTDAPSTEAPSTEAPSTEAPDEGLEAANERLRAEVERLSGGRTAPKTKAPSTTAPSTEAPIEEQDFLGDRDIDDVIRDPKEFNKLLNEVYVKGLKASKGGVGAEEVSTLVRDNMTIVAELKEQSDKFFDSNKDLKPFRKVVAAVFEEVSGENVGKEYSEIMPKVAIETRKRLELPTPKAQPKKKTKTPKLPRKKSSQSRQQAPEEKTFDTELDAMDEALNN